MSRDKEELYRKRIDELYTIIQRLRPSSPAEDFEVFASYFTPDCTLYLKSMRLHFMPAISRHEAIEDIKEVVENFQIEQRKVLQFSMAPDGYTVFCETEQRLNVMGDIVEPYFETDIATFDDEGLIRILKTYSCWSPIVDVVQKKTGIGPYDEGERREQLEATVRQRALERIQKRKERMNVGDSKLSPDDVSAGCCS
jgi:hypothetical protein